jgi:class 3 adenylate cyclase
VNIAARVATLADAGQTLVSSTVRDLVAGSGLRFEDRGRHRLKGLPEDTQLYAALGPG